jgi:hypothetical protein
MKIWGVPNPYQITEMMVEHDDDARTGCDGRPVLPGIGAYRVSNPQISDLGATTRRRDKNCDNLNAKLENELPGDGRQPAAQVLYLLFWRDVGRDDDDVCD